MFLLEISDHFLLLFFSAGDSGSFSNVYDHFCDFLKPGILVIFECLWSFLWYLFTREFWSFFECLWSFLWFLFTREFWSFSNVRDNFCDFFLPGYSGNSLPVNLFADKGCVCLIVGVCVYMSLGLGVAVLTSVSLVFYLFVTVWMCGYVFIWSFFLSV